MDTASPSTAPRGDTNIANLGAGARVKQFAQGTNITQIEGFTADQVRVLIADLRASYQPKPFDGRSPYVGLASFQEQDADRFFGREQLTQELVARLKSARWLVIAGPSGSGKSSLARAGLLHALRKGALDDSENWLYEILTPGRHPLEPLARVVSSFAKSLHAGDEMQQRGRDDATLLHRWAEVALGDQRARRAILLVDQFEESFTQADETERAAFFNLLLYAATIENGRVTIVVCTRSDFIGNWAAYPQLNAQLGHGVNQIPPLQWHELVSAIERPALQAGLQIDPALTEQIVFDMQTAPGALPLMQFALDDLFHYAKSKGGVIALTREDYIARGGLQQALSRHADAEFAKLNPREQAIARGVFARLVEPGRGAVDTKRTALFQEIVLADADAAQVHETLAKLADARLVTTDEKTVTLAHERLIDAWGWLRKLVDENREAIALQNQIAQDALEWEQHKRDASYLYTGARLATAQEQVADKKIVLSELAQAFVNESFRQEQKNYRGRRRTQQLMWVLRGLLIFLFGVILVVGAAIAFEVPPFSPQMVWEALTPEVEGITDLSRVGDILLASSNTNFGCAPQDGLKGSPLIRSDDQGRTWEAISMPLMLFQTATGCDSSMIVALVQDPSLPGHIYAATSDTGLIETRDWGKNWVLIGIPETRLGAVAVLFRSSPIVFVSGRSSGLYRSRDTGKTWERIDGVQNCRAVGASKLPSLPVYKMLATSHLLYVAVGTPGHQDSITSPDSGIYVSSDAGDCWVRLLESKEAWATAIAEIPDSNDRVLLAVKSRDDQTTRLWLLDGRKSAYQLVSETKSVGQLTAMYVQSTHPLIWYQADTTGKIYQGSDTFTNQLDVVPSIKECLVIPCYVDLVADYKPGFPLLLANNHIYRLRSKQWFDTWR